MKRHFILRHGFLALALVSIVCTSSTYADPVITLFDTGGVPGAVDSHYTITAGPSGAMSAYVTNGSPSTYPFDTWAANDSASQWISPQATYSSGTGDAAGSWTFQTTFSLSGFDKTTVDFVDANFWVSSQMVSISLNGTVLSLPSSGDAFSPTAFITALEEVADGGAGLLDGVNTLTFVVSNAGSGTTPTGLRVEIAANATPVPEPATFLLFGLAGVAILSRRRGHRIQL